MSRLRVGLPIVAALLAACGLLWAQDDKKADVKEPIIVKRGSLPANYKKLGLSQEQTKAIYKIRARYSAKIEALQQQISELREEERADLDRVLTEAQRARLKELRAGEPRGKEVKTEDVKKENK
jgi:hypothetical protein